MGIGGAAALALLVAAAGTGLVRPLGEAQVDWEAGTVTVEAGAAADIRMPTLDAARSRAVRQARAAAEAKLRAGLRELPLGAGRKLAEPDVERALGRAAVAFEYQSNGGAVARLVAHFGDWLDRPDGGVAAAPAVTLAVAAMPLEAAPLAMVGGTETAVACARYRAGAAPAAAKAAKAKRDGQGRLLLDGQVALAGAAVVIYVQKIEK